MVGNQGKTNNSWVVATIVDQGSTDEVVGVQNQTGTQIGDETPCFFMCILELGSHTSYQSMENTSMIEVHT